MRLLLLLSKENIGLSTYEALTLLDPRSYEQSNNLLLIDINPSQLKLIKRLAYTIKAYRFLFKTRGHDLEKSIQKFNWNKEYKRSFCLRINNNSRLEPRLSKIIHDNLKRPKTDLKNPQTLFEIHQFNKHMIATRLIHQNKEPFNKRRPDLRPGFSPISLHPRLARCLVNLTGIKKPYTFYDPLCGTGGLLIEAAMMGIDAVGTDISWYMWDKSRKNLEYYNLKNAKVEMKDFFQVKRKYSYIATDLPYSKNTKNLDNTFYIQFLTHLKKILTKRAALIFPHWIDYRSLAKKAKLKIKKEFEWYIHRTLTRKMIIVEP